MRLERASDAEKVARDRLTAAAWGRHLTGDQFLAREAALRAHPFAVEAMDTWLWRDGSGAVLSSCETFRVPCVRDERRGHGVVIASVFTEPRLRGRGAASAMLEAVCVEAHAQGASVAALFSEVGAALYARVGFVAQPSFDVVFPARTDPGRPCVSWDTAVAVDGAPQGTLELTALQADWHVARERFYAQALHRPAPATHGARLGESACAWAASFQTNELHVLWYRFARDDEAAALIAAARHVAQACQLTLVRFWETEPLPLGDGARVERTDELPMLRALDGGPAAWVMIHRGLWA
ncbi:MAG: GNAT family N-acetyltransferase [Myxococcaceae bacterium]|nr:GNAT family N-acetyltransferase [Myxococcaceae bacterium]